MAAAILIVDARSDFAHDLILIFRESGFRPVGPARDVVGATNLLKGTTFDAAILSTDLLGRATGYFAAWLEAAGIPTVFIAASRDIVLPWEVRADYVCSGSEDAQEVVDCLKAALNRQPYVPSSNARQLSLFDIAALDLSRFARPAA